METIKVNLQPAVKGLNATATADYCQFHGQRDVGRYNHFDAFCHYRKAIAKSELKRGERP